MIGDEFGIRQISTEGTAIEPIDKGAGLLELGRIKESSRDFNTPVARTCGVGAAAIEFVGPIFKAGLIRFAAEEVEILLLHEVFIRVDRVCRRCRIGAGNECCISLVSYHGEGTISRTKLEIRERWSDGVEILRINIETVVASAVCDGRCGAMSRQADGNACQRTSTAIANDSAYCCRGGRRRGRIIKASINIIQCRCDCWVRRSEERVIFQISFAIELSKAGGAGCEESRCSAIRADEIKWSVLAITGCYLKLKCCVGGRASVPRHCGPMRIDCDAARVSVLQPGDQITRRRKSGLYQYLKADVGRLGGPGPTAINGCNPSAVC